MMIEPGTLVRMRNPNSVGIVKWCKFQDGSWICGVYLTNGKTVVTKPYFCEVIDESR